MENPPSYFKALSCLKEWNMSNEMDELVEHMMTNTKLQKLNWCYTFLAFNDLESKKEFGTSSYGRSNLCDEKMLCVKTTDHRIAMVLHDYGFRDIFCVPKKQLKLYVLENKQDQLEKSKAHIKIFQENAIKINSVIGGQPNTSILTLFRMKIGRIRTKLIDQHGSIRTRKYIIHEELQTSVIWTTRTKDKFIHEETTNGECCICFEDKTNIRPRCQKCVFTCCDECITSMCNYTNKCPCCRTNMTDIWQYTINELDRFDILEFLGQFGIIDNMTIEKYMDEFKQIIGPSI